jgi:hypothetical protein
MTFEELTEIGRLEKRLEELKLWWLEEKANERPINYRGQLPRPACNCNAWGCWGCCLTEQQMRSQQGTFS